MSRALTQRNDAGRSQPTNSARQMPSSGRRHLGLRRTSRLLLGLGMGLAAVLAPTASWAGSDDSGAWAVDSFTADVSRTTSGPVGSVDSTDFYYPLVAATDQAANEDAFPLVVFLQGAKVDKGLYSRFASGLAAEGYVVAVPNHIQSFAFAPPPLNLIPAGLYSSQRSVSDLILDVTARDSDPASPLFRLVDTDSVGVSGHSFGGAAALYSVTNTCQPPFCFGPAASYRAPAEVKAAALFGTNTADQAGNILDADNARPVVFLQGAADGQATVDETSAMWPLIEPSKGLVTLAGVNHWGITNIQDPPTNTPETNAQTQPQGWSIAKTVKYAARTYDAYLKGDAEALKSLIAQQGETGIGVDFEAAQ